MPHKPNILDRAIEYIAPDWAARRAYARTVLEVNASYRGGVQTNTDRAWGTNQSVIGGMTQDRYSLGTMRSRARKADRDNYIARSILDTETDYVVGDGFTLQAKTDSKDFNREAEAEFAEWMDRADVRGMLDTAGWQRMLYRTSRRDGDVGCVLVDRGGESRIQIIPGDLIDSGFGEANENIVSGVEINAVGRPVAFHVLPASQTFRTKATRITAENFKYLAWFNEALMVRGETCFAQVFSLLDQIDGYTDAVVVAARMAAVFGLIFKEPTAAKQFQGLPTLPAKATGEQRRAVTLDKNGLIKYVGNEGDVVQVDAKQPMSQTPDFIRAMLRMIGLPFGMPLELIAKDVSQSNLSALRGVRQDYYRSCRPKQHRFAWAILTPIYQWWVSRRINAGEFVSAVPEVAWSHEWMPSRIAYTDPVTEAQAALLERELNLNSPQRQALELGRDYETLLAENKAAAEAMESAGLPQPRSTYTRDTQAAQAAPAATAANAEPAEPDDTEPNEEPDDGEETEQA